ncbi:MAG: hypothetical protein IPG96_05400 [Proteobacteria bacterium]|nr:hypothetical protein [Pseudomonadota bacterium]
MPSSQVWGCGVARGARFGANAVARPWSRSRPAATWCWRSTICGLLCAGGCIVGRPDPGGPGGDGGGRFDGATRRCAAATPDACGLPTLYCAGTLCAACAAGTFNCDGIGGCESATSCEGVPCDLIFACAQPAQFCNPSTGRCQRCVAGWLNCDGRDDNACERAGNGCALGAADLGVLPSRDAGALGRPCDPGQPDGCGAAGLYCSPSFRECRVCDPGTYNCNRASAEGNDDGCETRVACCNPSARQSCLDTRSFCSAGTRACTPCADGWYNCDGVGECESLRLCF